ncbi:MAG: PDZ domain-containing protein [Clostridiales bacterium]|nr:PDZ domain-containing protein [Clostridiales bacterium]
MVKKFLPRLAPVLIAALLFVYSPPAAVYAESAEASEAQGESALVSDAEKVEKAGDYITQLMNMILDLYAGDPVTPEQMYEAALYGISNTLDDYSEYMSEEEIFAFTDALSDKITGIGVMIQNDREGNARVNYVLPDSPALEAGIRRGDIIVSVNGQSTLGMGVSEITDMITDPGITAVTVGILREAETLDFEMEKRELTSVSLYTDDIESILGQAYAGPSKYIKYVSVNSVSVNTAEDLEAAIIAAKKENISRLILDLRGNSGGYLDVVIDMCNLLVPEGPVFYTVDSKGNRETFSSSLSIQPFEKIIILADGGTASAAELFAAAMQDSGAATVIGETTFGKGLIQTVFNLSSGGALKLTTEKYLRRSGGEVNGIGVIPDIELKMSPDEYNTAQDAALIKAVELLSGA